MQVFLTLSKPEVRHHLKVRYIHIHVSSFKGMVSGLWVISDSLGGYLGDTFGSLTYDKFGFQAGTSIMMVTMLVSVVMSLVYIAMPGHRYNTCGSHEERQRLIV